MGPYRCRHTLAILAAAMLASAVLVAGASGQQARSTARPASAAPVARLTRLGYRHVRMTCTHRGARLACRWQADRGRARCTGVATAVRRRGRPAQVAIGRTACRTVARRSVPPRVTPVATSPVSKPPVSKPPAQEPPATGSSGGTIPLSNPKLGFNTYTTARTVTEQRQLGATVSRLFVDWALIEPSPGQWDWRQTDAAYAAMAAGGLKPLVVVYTAPCWARPSTDCSNPAFTGPPDPAYDAEWSAFVRAAAQRYPAAAGIEVWNEPNLDQSFLPRANPARYAALLAAAYHAVRATDAAMPVISGGLLLTPPVAGSGQVPGGYAAPQFLAAMYAAGARTTMDGLGVHVYPSDYVAGVPSRWDPAAMQTWLGLLDPVRAAAGATAQRTWITEMGVSTSTQAGWPAAATPSAQASDLGAMIAIARGTANVPYVIIHSLEDQTPGYDDPYNAINTGWGAFTDTGVAKPAACVVSGAFHGSLSCS